VTLSQALRYPFGGERWLSRIVALAVAQLVPVLGQLVLIGYGMTVARSVRSGQTRLPEMRWLAALADGAQFLVTALVYVVPLAAALPTILALGTARSGAEHGTTWMIAVLLPVAAVAVFPATAALKRRGDRVSSALARILSFVPLVAIILLVLSLFASGLDLSAARDNLNALGVVLLAALGLLALLLLFAAHIGAVRYVTTGRGLFDPPGNLRVLFRSGTRSTKLIVSFVLLSLIAVVEQQQERFCSYYQGCLCLLCVRSRGGACLPPS
jgi:hypothetical protein